MIVITLSLLIDTKVWPSGQVKHAPGDDRWFQVWNMTFATIRSVV